MASEDLFFRLFRQDCGVLRHVQNSLAVDLRGAGPGETDFDLVAGKDLHNIGLLHMFALKDGRKCNQSLQLGAAVVTTTVSLSEKRSCSGAIFIPPP